MVGITRTHVLGELERTEVIDTAATAAGRHLWWVVVYYNLGEWLEWWFIAIWTSGWMGGLLQYWGMNGGWFVTILVNDWMDG